MFSYCLVLSVLVACVALTAAGAEHPRLLFSESDLPTIRKNAESPQLKPAATRLLERVEALTQAPPLLVSSTGRGQPDKKGEMKGLEAARALQGRVWSYCMAFTLTGDRKWRDRAVAELDHALTNWKIWVDTAHPPPFDLMTGENCLTYGIAYDWLYKDLTADERKRLREGAERRGLKAYLDAHAPKSGVYWLTAKHNWNTVCHGGATVLALALEGESELSAKVLEKAVPATRHYWDHLKDDGGWDEGTGYWQYGHRYGLMAAEALRRSGRKEGNEIFARPGVKATAYFPMVFAPRPKLSLSFGDAASAPTDPIFYLLGREYRNADFVWYQDRAGLPGVKRDNWPVEALALLWRPISEPWLPEAQPGFKPRFDAVYAFASIGWAMLASEQPNPQLMLGFKNGSLAANHTHLDLNHVSVAHGDNYVLVDLGNRPYPADYFGKNRYSYYELGTRGHNTVLLGGKGQVHGRPGRLLGPIKGQNFEAVTGVADSAYEVDAPVVRRHVVFVARQYWVLLDEIRTAAPQSAEWRYHTYGTVKTGEGRHALELNGSVLEIIPAGADLEAAEEKPEGWIKPVNVLRLRARADASEHLVATVLFPRASAEAACPSVSVTKDGGKLGVKVGSDTVQFAKGAEGWQVEKVTRERP